MSLPEYYMGTFFFTETMIDLVTESIGFYLTFLIPSSIMAEPFNNVGLTVGLSHMVLVIVAFLR